MSKRVNPIEGVISILAQLEELALKIPDGDSPEEEELYKRTNSRSIQFWRRRHIEQANVSLRKYLEITDTEGGG